MTSTVTFLSAPDPSTTAARVDDVELLKGNPVAGVTDDQLERLHALPGLRFHVEPDKTTTPKKES